jgi:hypothetical protein
MAGDSESANAPKMSRAIQDRIGKELREMYAELLKQPLPENLIAPLRTPAEPSPRKPLEGAVSAMSRESTAQPSPADAQVGEPHPMPCRGPKALKGSG